MSTTQTTLAGYEREEEAQTDHDQTVEVGEKEDERESELDEDQLPRKIRRMDEEDSPWYEYQGEPLFDDDTDAIRDRVRELAAADDVVRYSPRNKLSKSTKIRTQDAEEFRERLRERFQDIHQSIGFIHGKRLLNSVCVRQKGERRTDVRYSPSFGRPAGLGGKEYYQQQVLLEILRYEAEVFWDDVVEPVFSEFHDRYPY